MSSTLPNPIQVSLSTSDTLWKTCFAMEHEMILTVAGRRIFPTLSYNVTGLDPLKMYSMGLHIDLVDDKKLRYVNGTWNESMSTEKKEPARKVNHHYGAQTGKDWMVKNVNFDQIRITNRKSREDVSPSYVHLHTQHRYIPVLSIYSEGGELVHVATIPHTEFITVTAYHRDQLNTLKTNNNPYSTGSRKERRRQQPSKSEDCSTSSPSAKRIKTEDEGHVPSMPGAFQPDLSMLQAWLSLTTPSMTSPSMTSPSMTSPSMTSPTSPVEVKTEEPVVPAVPTPEMNMFQQFIMAQMGFPFNFQFNPFTNQIQNIFPTPAVSPTSLGYKKVAVIKTEPIDSENVDVVS